MKNYRKPFFVQRSIYDHSSIAYRAGDRGNLSDEQSRSLCPALPCKERIGRFSLALFWKRETLLLDAVVDQRLLCGKGTESPFGANLCPVPARQTPVIGHDAGHA